MEQDFDVVVIGGGLSGLTAAIALAKKGLKIAVVSRGDPILCLSTGCIDLLATAGDPLVEMELLSERHPYRLVPRMVIEDAMTHFLATVREGGLTYVGSPQSNRRVLTPLGVGKVTCLVPETMEASVVQSDAPLHIVSFAGLKDFYPSYIRARIPTADFSVYDAECRSTMSLAARFESAAFVERFVSWLKDADITAERIGIPAVLGWGRAGHIQRFIAGELNRPVFEIPTLPPSVPGIRLNRALRRVSLGMGVQHYSGKPVGTVERSGGVVEAVTLATPGRSIRVNGRAFILATGSFVSGGLTAHREGVMEGVFVLPVYYPPDRTCWFGERFFPPEHPLEDAGVIVGRDFKPIGVDVENLFVAGSILAYSRVIRYGCGNGMAIVTGYAAAMSCLQYLNISGEGPDSCSKIA